MPNGKLPNAVNGLQLNFCKTLACNNFGLSDVDRYVLQHVNPRRPTMVCRECGAFPPLLNNQEVLNELHRLRSVHSDGLPACRQPDCDNFGLSVHSHKQHYHAFGFSGDRQRYRCKQCKSTFVDKWSGSNDKLLLQEALLNLLFRGYSVREICRRLSINPKTFYDHINHIASRCRRKLAVFDTRWVKHAQHYHFASHFMPLQPKSDNGTLWFATGEADSGYIVCQHINYSASDQPTGPIDHDPYQTPARFVSSSYVAEANKKVKVSAHPIRDKIDSKYQEILSRGNVEDPMANMTRFSYPSKGSLIRAPYTSYAHFMHLFQLCNIEKPVSIYLPQDPLLRSAALSISLPRLRRQNIDLMYVEEDRAWNNRHEIEDVGIVHMGWWKDRWAIASQANASKGICYLGGQNPAPEYWLRHASIRKTADYQQSFQALFEAFINEPRRKLRPGGLVPLLDIFRAWHNLCNSNLDGMTPAQQLKLTEHPFSLKQLLS